MDIGIGIGIGLLLGVVITYFLLQVVLKKSQQAKIDEMVKTRRSNKRKFKKRKNGLLI